MADQVAEVKGKTDIVQVVGSRVKLTRAGKYWKGLCPFHAEKSPSFFVSEELQIYKCFGCGESGDVFSFLQAYEGMNFRESLETLAEKVGVELEDFKSGRKDEGVGRLYEILNLAREYYHFILTEHKAGETGREYLNNRGVNEAVVTKFGLGWAPESWDGLLTYLVKKKGYKPEEVEKTGMALRRSGAAGGRMGDYYDRFRGRVVFPLADFRGRTVGFSGRILEDKEGEPKYINTPETSVYHKRELLYGIEVVRNMIRKKDRVLIMEGEFDVISSYQVGVVNVVGIKGSALTEEHVRLLMRLTKNLVLCLDADTAGDAATVRGIEVADKLGMSVEVIRLKKGKDPDELARKSPQVWKELVEKSMSVYQFFIESAFEKYDAKSGVGKKKISEELSPRLNQITNRVERAHYVKEVAKRLGVEERVVEAEMERESRKERVREVVTEKKEEKVDREEMLERFVWGMLLQLKGEGFEKVWKGLVEVAWKNPGLKRLSEAVEEFLKSKRKFEVGEWSTGLPSELAGLVSEVYLSQEVIDGGLEREKELAEAIEELKELKVRGRLKRLSVALAELEGKELMSEEEEEKLIEMQKEFSRLLARLPK